MRVKAAVIAVWAASSLGVVDASAQSRFDVGLLLFGFRQTAPARSCGCIPARSCARDRPTGNRLRDGNSSDLTYPSGSFPPII